MINYNKKNYLLKYFLLSKSLYDRTREARCSFEKRRQWNRSNWRQGVAAVWISFDRGTSDSVDYCPIKDSIERVCRAAFQRSKLGGRGFTRPVRKVQLHGDIPRLGAKRPPLYTANRLERYAARLTPPPLSTPCANDSRRERRPICVQDLAIHGELRDGIFIAPFRVSGVS